MTYVHRRIRELEAYRPPLTAQPDFGEFWERTLRETAQRPLRVEREPVATPLDYARVYRVTFRGIDETPLHAWYLVPAFAEGRPLPCTVWFHGYAGSKGEPEDHAAWLLAGFAVFAPDVRGQNGETGSLLPQREGMTAGWVTQNILDPNACYYRVIAVDALRAVEAAVAQPETDPARIALAGASQGGGLAMLTAALSGQAACAVAAIPNMCHMDYGVMHSTGSLAEVAKYAAERPHLLDRVLATLSYFDNMNLASRIRVPIHVTVSLNDPVCPPETVFAAYNRIEAEKELHVDPFSGHATGAGISGGCSNSSKKRLAPA